MYDSHCDNLSHDIVHAHGLVHMSASVHCGGGGNEMFAFVRLLQELGRGPVRMLLWTTR